MSSIHNRLPREYSNDSGDDGDSGDKSERRVVLSAMDRNRHQHIYIGFLRDSFDIAVKIHRHTAEGRFSFSVATKLHRQLARACSAAG
jgi:hypothetical protein